MTLNLNDLRLFVEIVEHQGILRAGRALGLPKSTISRRLAGLEEQLKARLVVRAGDTFTLTAAGRETFALAQRMVDAARVAEEQLLASASKAAGQVLISVSPMLAAMLQPGIAALSRSHPGLSLYVDVSDRQTEPLGDGPDLYLRAHAWPLRDSALIQRRICRTPMILAGFPGIAADELADVATIGLLAFGLDPQQIEWPLIASDGRRQTLRLRPRVISSAPDVLIELAEAEAGIVLAPESTLRPALQAGALVRILPDWTGPAVAVTLLSPPRHGMNLGAGCRRPARPLHQRLRGRDHRALRGRHRPRDRRRADVGRRDPRPHRGRSRQPAVGCADLQRLLHLPHARPAGRADARGGACEPRQPQRDRPTYLPENRSWFPIGLAASCVMLYRTDLVDQPPATFADLADPRFNGQFGMADPAVAAPAYPCVAQFFESLGDEGARRTCSPATSRTGCGCSAPTDRPGGRSRRARSRWR
jgi:DNA-binding transcriptional LysR family regulator